MILHTFGVRVWPRIRLKGPTQHPLIPSQSGPVFFLVPKATVVSGPGLGVMGVGQRDCIRGPTWD